MSPVGTALAAAAAVIFLSNGNAGIVVDPSSSAALARNAAAHASFLRQHVVSRNEEQECSTSQEFQDCLESCQKLQPQCEERYGKCTRSIARCTAPKCCSEVDLSGTAYISSMACSESCCVGFDKNGDSITAPSCKPVSPSSQPIRASPAKSPAATPGTSSARPSNSDAAAPSASSTSSKCFPAHATVELESGARLRMDELSVGDRVRVGKRTFSDVFLFTHKLDRETANFVVIQTASHHKVSMTPGHYVYVNGTSLVPAASVQVGDELTLESGARSAAVSVSEIVYTGVYNPQTLHGDVVVDGIVASTYTTAVSPVLGHASLSPLRALYSVLGFTTGLLNGGADYAARLLPSGGHSY